MEPEEIEAEEPLAKKKKETTSAARLYSEAKKLCTVWKSMGSEFYVDISWGTQRRTVPLPSSKFEAWLRQLFNYVSEGDVPTDNIIQRVISMLVSDASFVSSRQEAFVRVGSHGGNIYIDRATEEQGFIKVSPEGWEIVGEAPIKFVRTDDVQSLPIPERSSQSLRELIRPFLSVKNDNEEALLIGYLFGLLLPKGPYPVLVITGEHGAAKSTTVRFLRSIVDPHTLDMREPFKDVRDFTAAVRNSYCLAFDNVSYVSNWLSDSLCALATGTRALGGRALYTNSDESAFRAMRPILCNGIPDFIRKPDLVDRIIKVDLKRIKEYISDEEYWEKFEEKRAEILGALLDCIVVGLRTRATQEVPSSIRMVHFTRWVCACEEQAGFPKGTFVGALLANKKDSNASVVEFSPLGIALTGLLEDEKVFYGSYAELKTKILKYTNNPKKIPETTQGIAAELKNITESLTSMGILVKYHGRTNEKGERRGQTIVEILKNA